MKRLFLAVLPILAIAFHGPNLAAEATSPAEPPWPLVPILDDRLVVKMPPGAQAEPVPAGLMAAEAPHARQQRATVELEGGVRMTILATELFHVAGPDMDSTARAFASQLQRGLKLGDARTGPVVTTPEGLEVVYIAPGAFTPVGDSQFVGATLVKSKDGTLQSLGYFTNTAGIEAARAVRDVAARINASIQPGSRTLQSGGRFASPNWPFELELPFGYTMYAQRGPDFQVYRVLRLSRLDEAGSELGIYVGSHPQKPSARSNAVVVRKPIFGNESQWSYWTSDSGPRAENYFSGVGPGKLSGHAFVIAEGPEQREALVDVAGKVKFR
ncbi:MAG TPA: hypothetical protein VH301_15235 [Usitatibacter sp.]|nr:hypothetical protein [Usitatibacter sp.]